MNQSLGVVPLLLISILVVSPATSAKAAIRLERIAFDPNGNEADHSAALNRELIVILNTGDHPRDLSGWTVIEEKRNLRYRIPQLTLEPGAILRLRSGRGTPSIDERGNIDAYWGRRNEVWRNDYDRALLKNRATKTVDSCRYSRRSDSPKKCLT